MIQNHSRLFIPMFVPNMEIKSDFGRIFPATFIHWALCGFFKFFPGPLLLSCFPQQAYLFVGKDQGLVDKYGIVLNDLSETLNLGSQELILQYEALYDCLVLWWEKGAITLYLVHIACIVDILGTRLRDAVGKHFLFKKEILITVKKTLIFYSVNNKKPLFVPKSMVGLQLSMIYAWKLWKSKVISYLYFSKTFANMPTPQLLFYRAQKLPKSP